MARRLRKLRREVRELIGIVAELREWKRYRENTEISQRNAVWGTFFAAFGSLAKAVYDFVTKWN